MEELQYYLGDDGENGYIKLLDPDVKLKMFKRVECVKELYKYDPVLLVNLNVYLYDYSDFTNLLVLDCSFKHVSYIPDLPSKLEKLVCSDNRYLKGLPRLPTGLLELECENCSIIELPVLPQSLRVLKCCYNKLSVLPDLPGGLLELDCSYNFIRKLPKLPKGLKVFDCSYNRLVDFPKLPIEFRCEGFPPGLL